MRKLLFIGLVLLISIYYFENASDPAYGILQHSQEWDREVAPVASTRITYVLAPDSGKFEPEIVKMFHVIFPMDGGGNYTEPDSNNTRIFWIDKWSYPESDQQYILIETSAGYTGGSCGDAIKAGVYDKYEEKWAGLIEDCGHVDSVFSLRHNGVCDFTVSYRWSDPVRYQYNGSELVGTPVALLPSDTSFIAEMIDNVLQFNNLAYVKEHIVPDLEWNAVNLDSSLNPYLFVQCSMDGVFIIHEESPNVFRLVNFLKGAVVIDIQNQKHNNFPDLSTLHTDFTERMYRWNGYQYILHKSERWTCPA